jgi:hypothetical protein
VIGNHRRGASATELGLLSRAVSAPLLAVAFALALVLGLGAAATVTNADEGATIATDRDDYEPFEVVTFRGSGFAAGEFVIVVATGSLNGSRIELLTQADESGAIADWFQLPAVYEPTYDLIATGTAGSKATNSFTDAVQVFIQTPSNPVDLWPGQTQVYEVIAKSGSTPVAGVPITWSATGGSVSPTTGTTGANGLTLTTYTPGATLGRFQVVATVTTDTKLSNSQFVDIVAKPKTNPVITWSDPADITYGTLLSSTQLNASASVAGTFVYSPAAGTLLSAGNAQTLSTTFTPTDTTLYNTVNASVAINVLKANATVTVNGYTGTYDAAAHGATGTATGIGGADLSGGLSLGASFTNVPGGTASWTFSGGTNYNDQNGTAPIVITKATPTVTAADRFKIYDGEPLGGSATATGVDGGGLTPVTYTYSSGSAPISAGTYSYTASFGGNGNYEAGTSLPAGMEIQQASASVAAVANTKTYGATDPALATTNSGFVAGDLGAGKITFSASRAAGENVGTYTITPAASDGTSGLLANYQVAYTTATFEITKKSATVQADAKSRTYGETNPALTATVTGAVGAETLSYTLATTATAGSNVGPYPITVTLGSNPNYDITATASTLTVNKKATASTVTVTPGTQQYTGAVTFTATLSPAATVGGDAPATTVTFYVRGQAMGTANLTASNGILSASLSANLAPETVTGALVPGSAQVRAEFGGVSGNYTVNDATTTLNITPKLAVPTSGNAYYTGENVFWTTGPSSSTATLFLGATLTDPVCAGPAPYYLCDITKARVTFAVRNSDGTTTPITGATNLPVGLADPSNPAVGTVAASLQYNIGNQNSETIQLAVRITGYYIENPSPATDGWITIAKPVIGNRFAFAGTELSNDAATSGGTLRAAPGYSTYAAGDVTYNNRFTNPQGKVSITVYSYYRPDGTLDAAALAAGTPHTYVIRSNAISTLSISNRVATFTAKANIQQIFGDGRPALSVDGGALLQISVTDGASDLLGVQVSNSKSGGLWFSSNWNGLKTVPIAVSGGAILVQ